MWFATNTCGYELVFDQGWLSQPFWMTQEETSNWKIPILAYEKIYIFVKNKKWKLFLNILETLKHGFYDDLTYIKRPRAYSNMNFNRELLGRPILTRNFPYLSSPPIKRPSSPI